MRLGLVVAVISGLVAAGLIRWWFLSRGERAWRAARAEAVVSLLRIGPGNMRAPYDEEILLLASGEVRLRRTRSGGEGEAETPVNTGHVAAERISAVVARLEAIDTTPLAAEDAAALPDSAFSKLTFRRQGTEQGVGWPSAQASARGREVAARLRPLAEAIVALAAEAGVLKPKVQP